MARFVLHIDILRRELSEVGIETGLRPAEGALYESLFRLERPQSREKEEKVRS